MKNIKYKSIKDKSSKYKTSKDFARPTPGINESPYSNHQIRHKPDDKPGNELHKNDERAQLDTKTDVEADVERLSARQQQFVLKFCRQLASVIEACERSECAEIEIGRRQINTNQIKVKLQAERELTLDAKKTDNSHL